MFDSKDLNGLLGMHFIYIYDHGGKYEWYARNNNSCDYRIHNGPAEGRCVTNQEIQAVQFAPNIYKVDWHENTGVCVSLLLNLNRQIMHGTVFFPQWIKDENLNREEIIYRQDGSQQDKQGYKNFEPIYLYVLVPSFAKIIFSENAGVNNNEVINIS